MQTNRRNETPSHSERYIFICSILFHINTYEKHKQEDHIETNSVAKSTKPRRELKRIGYINNFGKGQITEAGFRSLNTKGNVLIKIYQKTKLMSAD